MSLAELRIENLRCIESAALEFSPELNLIAGENGAGKTSILEAIFLLGRGRSFRTRSSERLIRHGQPKLDRIRPHGRFATQAAPESRSPQTAARAPGSTARTRSRCSSSPGCCPSRRSIRRFTSSSTRARSAAGAGWTGWCSTWNQALASTGLDTTGRSKQRNAALRSGRRRDHAWDAELIRNGEAITEARQRSARATAAAPGANLRALRRPGRDRRASSTGWAGGHVARGSAADARGAGSSARDHHRRTTSRRCHAAAESPRCPRDAFSRPAEADRRGDDRVAAAAAAGRARTCAPCCFWTTRRPNSTRKICSDLFEELAALRCQMIATSLTPETALFQAPKATFHVEQGRVKRL